MYTKTYFSGILFDIAYIFTYLHVQSDQCEVEHIYFTLIKAQSYELE